MPILLPQPAHNTAIPKLYRLPRSHNRIGVRNRIGQDLWSTIRSATEITVSMRLRRNGPIRNPRAFLRCHVEVQRQRFGLSVAQMRQQCREDLSLLQHDCRRFKAIRRNEVLCFALDVLRPDKVQRPALRRVRGTALRHEVIAVFHRMNMNARPEGQASRNSQNVLFRGKHDALLERANAAIARKQKPMLNRRYLHHRASLRTVRCFYQHRRTSSRQCRDPSRTRFYGNDLRRIHARSSHLYAQCLLRVFKRHRSKAGTRKQHKRAPRSPPAKHYWSPLGSRVSSSHGPFSEMPKINVCPGTERWRTSKFSKAMPPGTGAVDAQYTP